MVDEDALAKTIFLAWHKAFCHSTPDRQWLDEAWESWSGLHQEKWRAVARDIAKAIDLPALAEAARLIADNMSIMCRLCVDLDAADDGCESECEHGKAIARLRKFAKTLEGSREANTDEH